MITTTTARGMIRVGEWPDINPTLYRIIDPTRRVEYYADLTISEIGRSDYVEVASYSDYHGTVADRANGEFLMEHYKEFIIKIPGMYDAHSYLILLDLVLPEELIRGIAGLADYPVFDDGTLDRIERDMFLESVESYLLGDFRSAVTDKLDPGISDTVRERIEKILDDDDLVRTELIQRVDNSDQRYYADTTTSIVVPDLKEITREYAAELTRDFAD